jgi:MFS family permease
VALVWPTMMALIGEKMPVRDRAQIMAAWNLPYLAGLVLGMSAGLQIGEITGDNRYAFYTSSGLLGLAALCMIAMAMWDVQLGGSFGAPPRPVEKTGGVVEETGDVLNRHWWQRVSELRSEQRTLLHMLWLFGFVQLAGSLPIPILTLYARDVLHLTQAGMVKVFAVPGLLTALLALPLGKVADRVGRDRAIRAGLVLGALGLALTALAGDRTWLVAGVLTLLGISYVVVMPAWMALTSELAPPERQGLALGAMNAAQGVGYVLASLAGAALYEYVGPTAPFHTGAALLAACAVACVFLVRRPRPAPSPLPPPD